MRIRSFGLVVPVLQPSVLKMNEWVMKSNCSDDKLSVSDRKVGDSWFD